MTVVKTAVLAATVANADMCSQCTGSTLQALAQLGDPADIIAMNARDLVFADKATCEGIGAGIGSLQQCLVEGGQNEEQTLTCIGAGTGFQAMGMGDLHTALMGLNQGKCPSADWTAMKAAEDAKKSAQDCTTCLDTAKAAVANIPDFATLAQSQENFDVAQMTACTGFENTMKVFDSCNGNDKAVAGKCMQDNGADATVAAMMGWGLKCNDMSATTCVRCMGKHALELQPMATMDFNTLSVDAKNCGQVGGIVAPLLKCTAENMTDSKLDPWNTQQTIDCAAKFVSQTAFKDVIGPQLAPFTQFLAQCDALPKPTQAPADTPSPTKKTDNTSTDKPTDDSTTDEASPAAAAVATLAGAACLVAAFL